MSEEKMQPDQRSLSDITLDIYQAYGIRNPGTWGNAAFICGWCDGLFFWQGCKESVQEMVEVMQDADYVVCPGCREYNRINHNARRMME